MKLPIKTLIATLAVAGSTAFLAAQDGPPERPQGGPGGPGGNQRPPLPPIMAVLDANKDGVIDSTEIDNAPAALRTLDKNGDGKLTREELRPPQRRREGARDDEGFRPRRGAGGPPFRGPGPGPDRGPGPGPGPRPEAPEAQD